MKEYTQEDIATIATVCHQANKAWCETEEDFSQQDWAEAANWQRESAITGVRFCLEHPGAGESAQHDSWYKHKLEAGWVYGTEKDVDKKTHPCLVPFRELSEFQQKKDKLFCAIVEALK